MNKILEAAQAIATARRDRTPLRALAADVAPQNEADGYRIQDAVHDLLAADVGALVGYKIGCTSAVMQQYLGIPHPCAGGVFEKGVHASGVSLRHGDFVRVGVECEIAVRLGRDLAPSSAAFTAESVAGAIEAYHPAIEIVDDRYADWQTIGAPTLVADDFFAAACVLGAPVSRSIAPDLLDVVGCSARRFRAASRRICLMSSAAPSSTASRPDAAPAPTYSVIRTPRWRGSPITLPPRANTFAPARSC